MKINQYILSLSLFLLFISFPSYAEYFYMDKPYADILVKNPIRGPLSMNQEKNLPSNLIKFKLTSGTLLQPMNKEKRIEILYPSQVIEFMPDGQFNYIWMTGPSKIDQITGNWKIENSQLIFIFTDDKHSPIYTKNTQMRYQIVNIANAARTKLTLQGLSYASVTNILATSDSPIADFNKISDLSAVSKNNKLSKISL